MRRPEPPQAQQGEQTVVDRFVLARLAGAGVASAPPADRVTLIRRATFDLTGLPPTPEEVEAFVADQAPDAFARLVDRLLDSPHYGERWGRYWLDVARYADNKGYVFFEEKKYPWAWTYRDWVVRAFNEDLPYDRFVLQQLAADQLDTAGNPRTLAGMGFLTLGARFMNNAHDILDDRIDVVTRGLMGLTVTCARCHDHKYDPITQADYYGLYGVFRSSVEPTLPPELPSDDSEAYRKFKSGMQERLTKLEEFIAREREKIIVEARARAAEYLLAAHRKRNHPTTENFMLLTDKGALNPAMIHRWEVYLKRARRANDPVWTVWHAFSALPDEGFAESAAALHKKLFAADADPASNQLVIEAFAAAPPNSMQQVAEGYGELLAGVEGRWQQAQQQGEGSIQRLEGDDEALRQVLYGDNSPPMIPRELSWGFLDLLPDRPTQNEYKKLRKEVETWSMNQPGAPPRAMVLVDAETPYEPVVFIRGNPHREGRPVERRFPALLSAPGTAALSTGSGRLELARRIVAPDNPLTARVLVNRVWAHHFGRGLVDTPSDFGLRSGPPSHPALLDWLAADFIAGGWSIKSLHRRIMNSRVYRQSSRHPQTARAAQRDPGNRLLWRFPRQRLDFEAMRDTLLAASGALDRKSGGPPVAVLNGFVPRRTVYGFVNRMDLPGLMRAFDFPEPAATSPAREHTTVPPQALFFLNADFVAECARRLLLRPDVANIADADRRVERIYRVLFSRTPDDEELALAREFLEAPGEPGAVASRAWKYGYGTVDEPSQRVTGFTELTHWTGERWQAGPKLPDPKLGWVFIDRNGGHPAATLERCAVRRWIAPAAGAVQISGELRHHPPQGDGVRARIVSSRHGLLGTWQAHHAKTVTAGIVTEVRAGDTIDFVVDFNSGILHDEHEWPVELKLAEAPVEGPATWDSQADFRGAAADPWIDFVHALLMTNELVHVD